MDIGNCKAYRLLERQELTELDSVGYRMEHIKTRAKFVLIENRDKNKVFSIGFRTPPKDSTGVAHIVEHTVLCGSAEFPVKDPFIELAKGSLNTFLNAMTYPDKTVYPVASCNDKDFQNLMHVYLDAVLFPNIYKEEKIFRQEGWHYELEDPEAELKFNGVVFNEMKGVFSSPDQLLARNIQQSLFPDTSYGVESGGDPVAIPDLTYEDYLDFHSRYYHPSNSYIYLYGDMDLEEKLNWIDEHYLSKFDYLKVESEVKTQPSFQEMQEKNGFYSLTEGEETEGKAYFSYNAVWGDSLDRNLYQAFRILDYTLVQSVGAPLKQALLDAGIGSEIESYYDSSVKQPYFSIIAKNVRMDQKEDFLRVIKETLQKIVREGINEKSLRAAINCMEFQYREADFGNYPKGLMYGLQIFDSWLYDETKPFLHIRANDTFDFLKKQIGTGYFEEIIQNVLLDGTHTSFVSVEPKVGLTSLMEKEERERLAAYKAGLSEDERQGIVEETKALKAYQETPTPPEDLKCIPILARGDIDKKAQPFYNEEKDISGCLVLHHNVFTNGISYLRLVFDVEDLREYAPYLSLLTELIGYVDTDRYDKQELGNEMLIHAGSYSVNTGIYESRKDGKIRMTFEVSAKVLYPETAKVMELLLEMMTTSHVWDEKRLREVIGEARSSQQVSLQASGHVTARSRALSYLSESHRYQEQMKGIGMYDFLCDLEENFEDRKAGLIAILQELASAIFARERLFVDITADEEGCRELSGNMGILLEGLPESPQPPEAGPVWTASEKAVNEGFMTAGKVQYVARAGEFAGKGIPYSGVFKVIKMILSYDYLWNEVRVKGGAYGVMCDFWDSGRGFFVSYRDPNLAETDQVFQGVPEYLRHFSEDERGMMKYIIGTISAMDTPLTPRTKGARSFQAYMTDVTIEEEQRERDEVLSADNEAVRKTADMVDAILSDGYICVLGGEEKVKRESKLFASTRILK